MPWLDEVFVLIQNDFLRDDVVIPRGHIFHLCIFWEGQVYWQKFEMNLYFEVEYQGKHDSKDTSEYYLVVRVEADVHEGVCHNKEVYPQKGRDSHLDNVPSAHNTLKLGHSFTDIMILIQIQRQQYIG